MAIKSKLLREYTSSALILFPLLLGSVDVIEGSIEPNKPQSQDIYGVRQRGPASSFLENRGFGWLLEEEDDIGDDDLRPLLYAYM